MTKMVVNFRQLIIFIIRPNKLDSIHAPMSRREDVPKGSLGYMKKSRGIELITYLYTRHHCRVLSRA